MEKICRCSRVNRAEVMLIFLTISLRHNFTWEAITDIFEGINVVFGNEVVPSTKYKILKYFPIEKHEIVYHIYCPDCRRYLGEKGDEHCIADCPFKTEYSEPTKYFVTLNFTDQLRKLLETESIQKNLEKRFMRKKPNHESIDDIFDGRLYKKLTKVGQILHNKFNLSYTFSTDGCQSANSSNVTIWPIYIYQSMN